MVIMFFSFFHFSVASQSRDQHWALTSMEWHFCSYAALSSCQSECHPESESTSGSYHGAAVVLSVHWETQVFGFKEVSKNASNHQVYKTVCHPARLILILADCLYNPHLQPPSNLFWTKAGKTVANAKTPVAQALVTVSPLSNNQRAVCWCWCWWPFTNCLSGQIVACGPATGTAGTP